MMCALFAGSDANANDATELTFSLPEARKLVVDAALSGNTGAAHAIAYRLLQEDPNDPEALLAMSAVMLSYGDWENAFKASRKAFRTTDDKVNRFHAARVAATSAVADKRIIPAQFWLRRAGDLAPTEVERAKIERNFALLRAETPWRYKFNLSTTPSSNVNGGSDFAYNVIDGVPLIGFLSPDAQALSGLIIQSNATAGYRFQRNAYSQTEVNAGLYIKRVVLSEESKDKAPGYDPARLGATAVSLGLTHSRVLGPGGIVLQFHGGVRDNWVDSNRNYTAVTGGATLSRLLWERLRVTGSVKGERRIYTNETTGDTTTATLSLSYKFPSGSNISALVSFSDNKTPLFIFDNTTWVGRIGYSMGTPVLGGVELSAGVGASLTKYPDYTFLFVPVPGGRTDEGVFADFDARFTQIEYAGFSPTLRVRRALTDSNVSRFTTSEWSVSVGIESNF